ncbi:MAG TPA: protein kinase [Candidatus Eisenbacteria bacterium]|nr:protein kinase [Candidatus Eisenbacteria bacterium]
MVLTPKTRLGTYEILAHLGTGGMGEVYRARDLRLGRDVAVKVLPAGVAASPDSLARFEREARTVAGLNHPNIVTLHSVEDEDGIRFLTMELVEGQNLTDLIPVGGLPFNRVLELSIPLADALVAAHERGVVHRDLKPGNVMVNRDGRVKVMDFGLAKMASAESALGTMDATVESPVSGYGQVVGTVPYMAPEQIRGEAVDARADLFALGIILFELTTGSRPFAGASPADVSSSILRDTPEPLTRARKDLPKALEHLVSRCLEKNPRDRAQTALDVSNELRRMRRELDRAASEKEPSDKVASIAVLPFVNRSANAEDEYFSDGLADELLNVLAKIRGLRVAARTSAFHFKGKDTTIAEIGSALHVATVLEGSVRKAGNRVRISVQLVKVSDGYHLWSETYDRTLEDIFAVQDDIAQSVVKEMRTVLLGEQAGSDASGRAKAEVAKAAKGRATHPEAHRHYLMARHHLNQSNPEGAAIGIEHLRKALALDPEFALAFAELSRARSIQAGFGWVPLIEGYKQAREAAERALALEPDLVEGHVTMASVQMYFDRDWDGAGASLARALELAPATEHVLRVAGNLAGTLGRTEEAIRFYRQALEQDPLSAVSYDVLGPARYSAGQLAEAEAAFRKALELSPHRVASHGQLARIIAAQGRLEEAMAEAMREPEEAFRLWSLAIVAHATEHGAKSDAALRELIEKWAGDYAYQIAEVLGVRGELDAAFEWLDRAEVQRDPGLTAELLTSPHLRSLHGDPRWGAFLRKMGFEERATPSRGG